MLAMRGTAASFVVFTGRAGTGPAQLMAAFVLSMLASHLTQKAGSRRRAKHDQGHERKAKPIDLHRVETALTNPPSRKAVTLRGRVSHTYTRLPAGAYFD